MLVTITTLGCPWCNHQPAIRKVKTYCQLHGDCTFKYSILCTNGGCMIRPEQTPYTDIYQAVDVWNTRTDVALKTRTIKL